MVVVLTLLQREWNGDAASRSIIHFESTSDTYTNNSIFTLICGRSDTEWNNAAIWNEDIEK